MHFLERIIYFNSNFTEVCFNSQEVSTGAGEDLVPFTRQAITWTSVDQGVWRHVASLCHNASIQGWLLNMARYTVQSTAMTIVKNTTCTFNPGLLTHNDHSYLTHTQASYEAFGVRARYVWDWNICSGGLHQGWPSVDWRWKAAKRNKSSLRLSWASSATLCFYIETRQIGIWKLRPAYSPETPNLRQIGDVLSRVTLKFDGWPRKRIGHLSFAVLSFVQHFIAINEFKLELQSGNAQFGSNSTIFRAAWPWNLTYDLEKR